MPAKKGRTNKAPAKMPAPVPAKGKKAAAPAKKEKNPLFESRPKVCGIGGDLRPGKRDLSRYVRWPLYIQLQRKRKILSKRLKIPPAVNLFSRTVDKSTMAQFLRIASTHRPETSHAKKNRLLRLAKARAENKSTPAPQKPCVLKYGLNHITGLVEQKKAKLVVIAHDVDPLELVVWLPALCRKMDVPYCIVKSKAVLGKLVHKKTAAAVAFTSVRESAKPKLAALIQSVRANFNDRHDEFRRQWGGGIMGIKSQHRTKKNELALEKELRQKAGLR